MLYHVEFMGTKPSADAYGSEVWEQLRLYFELNLNDRCIVELSRSGLLIMSHEPIKKADVGRVVSLPIFNDYKWLFAKKFWLQPIVAYRRGKYID